MKQKPPKVQAEYFCDTRSGIQLTSARTPKVKEDCFCRPIGDWKENEEAQAESKFYTTEQITLPLRVLRSLETQLFKAQLNRTKIKMLEEECKRIAKELEWAEEKLRARELTIEVLAEMYKKEPAKTSTLEETREYSLRPGLFVNAKVTSGTVQNSQSLTASVTAPVGCDSPATSSRPSSWNSDHGQSTHPLRSKSCNRADMPCESFSHAIM